MNKIHSESWSSTSVSPSIVSATTTLKIFALALFWSLPTNHPSSMYYIVKYIGFIGFSIACQPVNVSFLHSPHRLPLRTWASFCLSSALRKFHNYGGEPTFPPEIVQICYVGYWAQKLRNAVKQYSLGKLHNLAQHYGST